MKSPRMFGLLAVTAAGLLNVQAQSPDAPAAVRARTLDVIQPLPDRMPGAENDTASMIQLGRRLYFEKKLSQNETQSCNSCHAVDGGGAGVDHEPTSPGAFGKRGDRNSPTTWNAGFHMAQFWDGRAEDLAAQAKGPVLNPVEMAMPAEAEVIARLRAEGTYPDQFKQAFPDAAEPLTYENLARAIAAFERTLITRDRFDEFLRGTGRTLTAKELKGLDTFLSVGCATCHHGPLLGGNSFQKMGLVQSYDGGKDPGRRAVTGDESDESRFKVPSLRNVAATYPYFHDGQAPDLATAVRQMGRLQMGIELADEQVDDITAFLQTLTGEGIKTSGTGTNAPAATAGGGY